MTYHTTLATAIRPGDTPYPKPVSVPPLTPTGPNGGNGQTYMGIEVKS